MSFSISKLVKYAESYTDQHRFLPAVLEWELVRKLTKPSALRACASYSLGVIHWHHLGNGINARSAFLASIADLDMLGYGEHQQLTTVHANALENAMLCALSFDEFENLAARLDAVVPGVPILVNLVPEVRNWRERGDSWSGRLFALAATYYNRDDPRRDIGRYGSARSTYHLILTHRSELRVPREDWRMALFEFCALSMRMASDCSIKRGGVNDLNTPEEFLPILTEGIALADEYLQENSGDEDLRKTRGYMEQMVNNLRQLRAVLNEKSNAMSYYFVCQECGAIFERMDSDDSKAVLGTMPPSDYFTVCGKCGGIAVWKSKQEIIVKLRLAWTLALLLLGILAALVVFFLK